MRYGNASFDRSAVVRRDNTSRDRGPWTVSSVRAVVMSVIATYAPPSAWRRSHASIRRWITSAPTTTNASSFIRVTVTSVQIPAFGVSHCVYTIVPTGRSIRLTLTFSSRSSAPGPWTRIFAMNDMSITPTASRTARCSTAPASNAWSRPHVGGRSCDTPSSTNHSGTS